MSACGGGSSFRASDCWGRASSDGSGWTCTSSLSADERHPRHGVILVLYHAVAAPLRPAIADHLNSIRRYSGRPCIYINLAARPSHAGFTAGHRPGRLPYDPAGHALAPGSLPSRRIAPGRARGLDCPASPIPQDEFLNTDPLVDFLRRFGVGHVFTCAPSHEWETIYGR